MTFKITATANGFMLDTNVFNHLVDGIIQFEQLPKELPLFVTHVQFDEVMATKAKKRKDLKRKEKILKCVKKTADKVLLTKTTMWGVSRWGMTEFSDGKPYWEMVKMLNQLDHRREEANRKDALIAEVALLGNLILVTNDRHLKKVFNKLGGSVLDIRQEPSIASPWIFQKFLKAIIFSFKQLH